MKKIIIVSIFCLGFAFTASAAGLGERLAGKILLQVEDKGQAWYVEPGSYEKIFLGRPDDAFRVMRKFGLGVSEKDYQSFQIKVPERLYGKILLRVEAMGEAYYINLAGEIFYLGRPEDAFSIMRNQGLGIKTSDLSSIKTKAGYEEKEYPTSKKVSDEESIEKEVGESEDVEAPEILDLFISDITSNSAHITIDLSEVADIVVSVIDNDEEEIATASDFGKDIYNVDVTGIVADSSYYLRIELTDEAGNVTIDENYGFETDILKRDLIVGEKKKITQVTVLNSYPQLVSNGGGVYWWDGAYALFSRYDIEDNYRYKNLQFNGSTPGGATYNGLYYGVAWEKNCKVYVDVVNNLNNPLSESKSLVSRAGEGCPTNISLSSDGNEFALIWTSQQNSDPDSLYIKAFNYKGLALNNEIEISNNVDIGNEPRIVWDGENYLVFYSETVGDLNNLYLAKITAAGQLHEEPRLIKETNNSIANLNLIFENGEYELFWTEKQTDTVMVMQYGKYNFEDDVLTELEIKKDFNVNDKSFSVIKNDNVYAVAYESEGVVWMFEFGDKGQITTNEISLNEEGSEAKSPQIIVSNGEYRVIWHENSMTSKSVMIAPVE